MYGRNQHLARLVVVALTLALGGCAGWGGDEKPQEINPNIYPTNYREMVANFLRSYLSNPANVRDAYISAPTLKPVGRSTHYVSCVRYNAGDSDNRYAGSVDRVAEFLGGRLNQFVPATPEICANAVYQRFPEAEALKS